MSKYQPLQQFLSLYDPTKNQAPLTFEKIEQLLGCPLPPSARENRRWWQNDPTSHVQAKAWLDAGWQAWKVNLAGKEILFSRKQSDQENRVSASVAPSIDDLYIDLRDLSVPAAKLLRDYISECEGDSSAAIRRALHEAAMARRGRLIDRIRANAPNVGSDSVDLIREDRDAR